LIRAQTGPSIHNKPGPSIHKFGGPPVEAATAASTLHEH
jgi:hypothetical protein